MTDALPKGWTRRPLSEFIVLQRGFDLPKRNRRRGSIKVLSSGEVSGWHDEARVSGRGFVVGRATNIGRPTWSDDDYWPLNTVLYAKDFLGNDPKFAYYWFLATDLTAYNSGSVQAMLNRNYIASVPVAVPPIEEQRDIAATLGALDNKIESNRRSIGLLRGLAVSTLSAAVKGRRAVADVAEIRKGLSYKGAHLVSEGEGMPMVNMGNAENFGWLKRSGFKFYNGETKSKHHVAGGSLLVTGVEQTWKHEIIGWPLLVPDDVDEALFTHHMLLVDFAPENEWMRLPLWAFLYTREARAVLEGSVYGTTVATLPVATLGALEFSIPNPDSPAIPAAESMLRRAWCLERESHALASTRDALLPALLSGKVRVMDGVV